MLCLAVTRILPVHCYVGPPWSALSSGTTTLMGRNAFEFNETLAGGRLIPKKKNPGPPSPGIRNSGIPKYILNYSGLCTLFL